MENERVTDSDVKRIARTLAQNLEIEEEEAPIGVLSDEELDRELTSEVQFDVFEDIINPRIKKGDVVKYDVYVDSTRVASNLTRLSSWGDVHKDYAPEGGYVMIKSRNSQGKWLKQQGMTFGKYKNAEDSDKEVNSQLNNGFTARDLMEMQAKQEDKLARLLEQQKITLEQANREKLELITTLMGTKKDDSGMEMFKFMLQQQQLQQQQFREDMRRQDELRRQEKKEADERFEKLLLTLSSKDNEVDPYTRFKEIQEAEDRGYNKGVQFYEMLEEKSESKALKLAEQNKDESISDKAIKSVLEGLPQIAGIIKNKASQGALVQLSNPAPQIQIPSSPKVALGMATISDNGQNLDQSTNIDRINNEEAKRQEQAKKIAHARNVILMLTLPTIGSDLLAEANYESTASKVKEILTEKRIDASLVVKLFTVDDFVKISQNEGIYDIAKEQGKEEALVNWLKGFYKSVYEKTTSQELR